MTIKWGLPAADRPLLTQVIERAATTGLVATKNRANLTMDLTACHLNGTPLDFARLLAFPDVDFAHDLGGISRYLDRDTGKLTDCFVPRCATRQEPDPVTVARLAVLDLIFSAESVD